MDLYYFETPNGRKPCAIANLLEIPITYHRVDLTRSEQKAPAYLALNPNGRIPVLVDGDVRLWESHAIMIYLAQKAGSPLWPSDPVSQADVIRWLQWDTAHFSRHAGRLLWENWVKPAFGMGEPDSAEIEDAKIAFKQFAAVLEQHLKGRTYLVGDRLTVADFGVASFLPMAADADLPLSEYPQIRRWHDALMKIPAWRDPWPHLNKAA